VNFWCQGDAKPHVGYTTNISMTGMFVATNSPFAAGSRIRVELVDRDRAFMVEGIVAHARRLQLELVRLSQSGMGVRFLTVEELVRELIPSGLGESAETEVIPVDRVREEPPPEMASPPPPAETAAPEPPPPQPTLAPASAKSVKAGSPPPPAAPVDPAGGSFTVRFAGVAEFLAVYQRDLVQGGLFVSTPSPARLHETVRVELYPPGFSALPVVLQARVVQRFEPQTGAGGPNLLSGMGLELMDLPALIARLEPVIARLKGEGAGAT
jgi:Tfp pilus assembly protein PilZ